MANIVYTNFLKLLMSGTVDVIADSIYVMLLSGTYVPSTGHIGMASLLPHQSTDPLGSYLSGGQLLVGKTLTDVAGQIVFDASDVAWVSSTITASGAAVYYSGSPTVRHPMCWVELGNSSSTNGTFQIVWNSTNGVFRIGGS